MKMSDNALIIFVKYPEPGAVKTRLAKEIGDEKACKLYRLFVETILAKTGDRSFKRIVFYHPPEKRNRIIEWLRVYSDIEIASQTGSDLGERLSNAFSYTFERGAKRVIAIGSDSPGIDAAIIKDAFRGLKKSGCVIGPSSDGGYYLIGLSRFYKEIFEGIDWSTDKVLKQTQEGLKRVKVAPIILRENFDVDKFEDLRLLKKSSLHYLIEAISEA